MKAALFRRFLIVALGLHTPPGLALSLRIGRDINFPKDYDAQKAA